MPVEGVGQPSFAIYLSYLCTYEVDKVIGSVGRCILGSNLGNKSIVAKASSNSPSVRATIPEEIVKQMQLSVGDVLDWEIEDRKNRKVMIVKKLE